MSCGHSKIIPTLLDIAMIPTIIPTVDTKYIPTPEVKMSNYRKHKHPQVHVRLPHELKEWVKGKADREGVPLNTMFVRCVEKMKKIEELAA